MSLRGLFVAFFCVLAAQGANAQTGTWTNRGPEGGTIYCLTADSTRPGTLYAGTDSGVYRTDDGGATWRASNAGIAVYRVQTIAIDPTSPNTLLAGTITPDGVASVGIFKSTDAGATWTDANIGLEDPYTGIAPVDIESLVFDPKVPGRIWAGSRFSEIYESADGGATWQPTTFGGYSIGLETSAFLVDPSSSLKVLAATNNGLARTTDGGATWTFYGDANVSFFTLAADPSNASTLYAGNTDGSGIYKSTDGGNHWTAINKGLVPGGSSQPLITALAVDPSRPATVYAASFGNGLFKSTDGGANWAAAGSSLRSVYVWSVLLAPDQPSTAYAGTVGAGVYKSTDSGANFSASNGGLRLAVVNALVADASSPSTFYAALFDGIYKSTDGGASWQLDGNGVPVSPVLSMVSRPGSPQTIFAGLRGSGLYKTSDGGATWAASSQGLTDGYVSALAVDPTAPATLYAGTSHPFTGSNSQRVFKSADGGATWTQTSLDAGSFSINSISVNPGKPAQVIAVSRGVSGYFQSLDSGKTWTPITTDLTCGGVNGIFFDPSGATTYLAGTAGLCRSTDGGNTWALTSVATLASIETLWIDPSNPSRMFAGASPEVPEGTGGVFQTADGGQSWQPVGTGLQSADVRALLFNPTTGNFLAGTHASGINQLVQSQNRQTIQRPTPSPRTPRQIKSR